MELKLGEIAAAILTDRSSNRTFMELKFCGVAWLR